MDRSKAQCITFLILLTLACSSCTVGRFVVYNFANITDHKKFPSRPLVSGETKFQFEVDTVVKTPKTMTVVRRNRVDSLSFGEALESLNSVAFLIIQNDTKRYEEYFQGYSEESVIASFSMAKSVTSILIGCAIDDGLIQSVDEPVTSYIPELADHGFDKVSIKHVLQMTSGLKFNESYINPFGHAASYYYGRRLEKKTLNLKLKEEPGQGFDYVSGNTQLLGIILERALKTKTVTEYFQEKLWTPLEMEYDGSWSIDRKNDGIEKTFCCINARARDFAKIGRLYLNKGNWNGTQIVSEQWVDESTQVDTSDGSSRGYQYQWWLPSTKGDYMAQGILGQYIYVNPSKNLIIVRMGKSGGGLDWSELFMQIAETY